MSKKIVSKLLTLVLTTALIASTAATALASSDLRISYDQFSSNTLSFCINQDAAITVGIYESTDDGNEAVKLFANESQIDNGCYSYNWNGTYEDGDEVDKNDKIFYWIKAENPNNTDTVSGWIDLEEADEDNEIDEEETLIDDLEVSEEKYDPWDSDDELEIQFELEDDAEVDVKIYKKSSNKLIKELADDVDLDDDDHYYDWDGRDEDGDMVKEGTYYVKVVAEDDDENKDIDSVTFKVKKGANDETDDPRLEDVFLSKASFDPGLGEYTYIIFTLTSEADLEINVYDDEEVKVADLYDKHDVDAGTYVYGWNGEKDNNSIVDYNSTYTIEIIAENSKGDDDIEVEVEVKQDTETSKKSNVYKDKTMPKVFEPDGAKEMDFLFKLSKDADVIIEVYDDGKVLATLFEGELDSGSNKIEWNGRTNDGDLITDGIYDYKVTSENYKGKSIEYGKFYIENSDEKFVATTTTTTTTGQTSNKCANYKDLSINDMYCEAIAWTSENDIFEGDSTGNFNAYAPINRVEAIKAILNAFDIEIIEGYQSNVNFLDVQNGSWYAKYVQTAVLNGIAQGYQNNTFKPGGQVVKAEALVMALNTAQIKGKANVNYCTTKPYADIETNVWYTNAICYSKAYNLLPAYGNNFYPTTAFTRGDMAQLLYNMQKAGIL
ncbi:hypothetical protein HOG17_02970 [Candidatus Peregrinibacteria bacterium]|jgi:flagellar hook assembly protein FlgD|nr:hypothetical protein [Candidatus Peregrinibacteria bacterium]MBT4148551.1 hypothetical protein [Candidatus Peregrinibacteria bacterium]MBT4366694.1 hypothetical protein [Candidatus Peregrinibacteria bacterium]MBT4455711.1 hypothetical protein [Candidatus Peregrinibacteria bacterium]